MAAPAVHQPAGKTKGSGWQLPALLDPGTGLGLSSLPLLGTLAGDNPAWGLLVWDGAAAALEICSGVRGCAVGCTPPAQTGTATFGRILGT